MTPYTVQWRMEAIEALFQIWVVAGDVAEVGRATNQIETVLGNSPEPSDSTDHEGLRLVNIGRLRIAYEVDHSGRTVEIC